MDYLPAFLFSSQGVMGMRHVVTTAVPVSRIQDRRRGYNRNDSKRLADRARPFPVL